MVFKFVSSDAEDEEFFIEFSDENNQLVIRSKNLVHGIQLSCEYPPEEIDNMMFALRAIKQKLSEK